MKWFRGKKGEESEGEPKKEIKLPEVGVPKLSEILPKPKEIPMKTKGKIKEYARVLRITKKPSKEEYKAIVKASALGMAIIGLVGFGIHMVAQALTLYR